MHAKTWLSRHCPKCHGDLQFFALQLRRAQRLRYKPVKQRAADIVLLYLGENGDRKLFREISDQFGYRSSAAVSHIAAQAASRMDIAWGELLRMQSGE